MSDVGADGRSAFNSGAHFVVSTRYVDKQSWGSSADLKRLWEEHGVTVYNPNTDMPPCRHGAAQWVALFKEQLLKAKELGGSMLQVVVHDDKGSIDWAQMTEAQQIEEALARELDVPVQTFGAGVDRDALYFPNFGPYKEWNPDGSVKERAPWSDEQWTEYCSDDCFEDSDGEKDDPPAAKEWTRTSVLEACSQFLSLMSQITPAENMAFIVDPDCGDLGSVATEAARVAYSADRRLATASLTIARSATNAFSLDGSHAEAAIARND